MSASSMQEIVLPNSPTGRRVMMGLEPHTPEYRGRLLGKRLPRRSRTATPTSCLQSGSYFLDMYFNNAQGCCTGVAWMEILNYVYGIAIPESVASAAFTAAGLWNGANEIDVLDYAETYPVVVAGQAYTLGPSATFDYSNLEAIEDAIATHKAAYWGVDAGYLQQCVGNVSGWIAQVITTPQTNYDHAVFSPDYGTLDQCATYINQQRGVTVTIGSLDPTMLCATLSTWDTLGIVPMFKADGVTPLTLPNTTGEGHVIESFPAPVPATNPPPLPVPDPNSHTRRGLAVIAALNRLERRGHDFESRAVLRNAAVRQRRAVLRNAAVRLGLAGADINLADILQALQLLYDSGLVAKVNEILATIEKELGL